MLYAIAHFLRDRMPFVWNIIEFFNSLLFSLRYGKKVSSINEVLSTYQGEYITRELTLEDLGMVLTFFSEQPQESFKFFAPHDFDAKNISRIIKNRSYLSFIVMKDEQMVGYFFLRCFFQGKCFRGKIVDYRWRNLGIAKLMGRITTDVAMHIGLRMYGTISKENVTSMASSAAVNEIRVIEELPNGFVYIEYLPKK